MFNYITYFFLHFFPMIFIAFMTFVDMLIVSP